MSLVFPSACWSSVVLLSQREEHCLWGVLKEGCPVLLLPFLHPVTIDLECIGIDEAAQRAQGIRVTDDDLPGHRLGPAVLVVDTHGGQHCEEDHLWDRRQLVQQSRVAP